MKNNFCDFDPEAITISQAEQVILETAKILPETEIVPIRDALGRVLRCDSIAVADNPPNDNSAMDGYGVLTSDCEKSLTTLTVVGKSYAGSPYEGEIKSGEAVRIMTGAKIPAGVDAVVMQEQTNFDAESRQVTITAVVTLGQNIRLQGEDITIGQTVIPAGMRLTPASIGVLASMGIAEVEVTRPVNVVVMSTGDELQSLGTPLVAGNIYDSNRYALHSLLNDSRFRVIEKGVLKDDRAVIEKTLMEAAQYADLIITTGGVSVGEADWIKDCVKTQGQLIFWKAAIKPGRPITFGKIGDALFFGLPGNPVSVMITFDKFVDIALQKLTGEPLTRPWQMTARLASSIRKRPGRVEFQRGLLFYDEQGALCVKTTGDQGSGILSSMVSANCLIELDTDDTDKQIGDSVKVEPLRGCSYHKV